MAVLIFLVLVKMISMFILLAILVFVILVILILKKHLKIKNKFNKKTHSKLVSTSMKFETWDQMT